MIKKEIYPKTIRLKNDSMVFHITEKLDGSNLCFFKKDNELHIALRKNIIKLSELEEASSILYKGLKQWLIDHGKELEENLNEGSAICGEWLGMGQLKYENFPLKYYMFAKANINEDFKLYNLIYDHSLFIYPFINTEIPEYIGIVPEVINTTELPKKEYLDSLYDKYLSEVNRPVEGFVINFNNNICKYVRMKNGKVVEYSEDDHKGS